VKQKPIRRLVRLARSMPICRKPDIGELAKGHKATPCQRVERPDDGRSVKAHLPPWRGFPCPAAMTGRSMGRHRRQSFQSSGKTKIAIGSSVDSSGSPAVHATHAQEALMFSRLLKTAPMVGATVLAAAFAFGDAQAQDSDRPVVRVASNVNIPLRIFRAGDEIRGYEYEVYKEALERAGYEVEVTDVAFSGLFSGLQAEQWDVVASNVFITPERHAEMDHSEPYLAAFDALMVREDDNVQSLEDLEGKVVGTETGTTQAAYAEALNEEYGPFEIRAYEDIETQMLDLEVGRIDGLTLGYPTARVYINERGLFEVLATNDASFMIGAFFRKGDPLRDEFDEALRTMKEDGTTADLFEEYFGDTPDDDSPVVRVFEEPYVPTE